MRGLLQLRAAPAVHGRGGGVGTADLIAGEWVDREGWVQKPAAGLIEGGARHVFKGGT